MIADADHFCNQDNDRVVSPAVYLHPFPISKCRMISSTAAVAAAAAAAAAKTGHVPRHETPRDTMLVPVLLGAGRSWTGATLTRTWPVRSAQHFYPSHAWSLFHPHTHLNQDVPHIPLYMASVFLARPVPGPIHPLRLGAPYPYDAPRFLSTHPYPYDPMYHMPLYTFPFSAQTFLHCRVPERLLKRNPENHRD